MAGRAEVPEPQVQVPTLLAGASQMIGRMLVPQEVRAQDNARTETNLAGIRSVLIGIRPHRRLQVKR